MTTQNKSIKQYWLISRKWRNQENGGSYRIYQSELLRMKGEGDIKPDVYYKLWLSRFKAQTNWNFAPCNGNLAIKHACEFN